MPPARLYADENFPLGAVTELRRLGHDVLTAYEDGQANQAIPDEDILARAVTLDRVLLTMNRKDFKRLHRQVVERGEDHAGEPKFRRGGPRSGTHLCAGHRSGQTLPGCGVKPPDSSAGI